MRKINIAVVVFTMISLFMGISQAHAEGESGLSIESVSINKVTPVGCSIRWQLTIKNNSAEATSSTGVYLNAAQGTLGSTWHGTGGTLLASIAPGASITRSMTFVRRPTAQQFRAQIVVQGIVIVEKFEALPVDSALSVEVSNCTITDTEYIATIRNLSVDGACNINIQGHAAISSNPNSWTPVGGLVLECLDGNGTYQRNGHKPSGYDMMKIRLSRDGVFLTERVFNFVAQNAPGKKPNSQINKNIIEDRKLKIK